MSMGLCIPVFLIFLVLKLTRIVNWAWVWITSPLWIACLRAAVGLLIWFKHIIR
jgi:hypothetical protein